MNELLYAQKDLQDQEQCLPVQSRILRRFPVPGKPEIVAQVSNFELKDINKKCRRK